MITGDQEGTDGAGATQTHAERAERAYHSDRSERSSTFKGNACTRRRCHLAQCLMAQSVQGIMITHRLRSLHILIHDEYRSTEKLSTGLRNTRLLVRPQLVSTAPVLSQWVLGARCGGAARRSRHMRSRAHGGNFPRCTRFQETVASHLRRYTGSQGRCILCVSSSHLARWGSCCAWLQGQI